MIHTDPTRDSPAESPDSIEAGAFARLCIGPWCYEMGEQPETEMLAYRGAAGMPWAALDCGLEDGWQEIAKRILLNEPDLLTRFLQTHMVRVSGDFARNEIVHFDTLGIGWDLRLDGDDLSVRLGDGEWQKVRLEPGASREGREWAVAGLLAAQYDLAGRFRPQMTEWAHRIAAGATVTPVL